MLAFLPYHLSDDVKINLQRFETLVNPRQSTSCLLTCQINIELLLLHAHEDLNSRRFGTIMRWCEAPTSESIDDYSFTRAMMAGKKTEDRQ